MHLIIEPEYSNNQILIDHYTKNKNQYQDDSGLDIICPEDIIMTPDEPYNFQFSLNHYNFLNEANKNIFGISIFSNKKLRIIPRSSIYKTPLRLTYENNKYILYTKEDYTIKKGDRVFQIIQPSLEPLQYKLIIPQLLVKTDNLNYNDTRAILQVPQKYIIKPGEICKIPLGIKCQPVFHTGYTLVLHHHILEMTNLMGLIDYGYRGEIMAIVENPTKITVIIESDDDIFELKGPFETPLIFKRVESLNESKRGEGGFGSTGN